MDSSLTVYCANDLEITILPASTLDSECSFARHNSVSATAEELASLREIVPSGIPLTAPPRTIYSFSHFAALVQQSQNIQEKDRHTITLPQWLAKDMLDLQTSYQITGAINETHITDISYTISSLLPPNIFTSKSYFIRLNDCSPKDAEATSMPISSIRQLVLCLLTSGRARGDFEAHVTVSRQVTLYLHAWDHEMAPSIEFRCFVPPVAVDVNAGLRVTALSQYHWHKPFPVAYFRPRQTVEQAITSATRLLPQILGAAGQRGVAEELRKWGFTFDVVVKRDGEVQLVEVNPFGAVSGCGSCLFNWVDDGEVLYGGRKGVEVRLLV